MFRPDGPKPWQTKVGQSRLEEHVQDVLDQQRKGGVSYTEDKTDVLHNEDGAAPKIEQ